MFNLLLTYF